MITLLLLLACGSAPAVKPATPTPPAGRKAEASPETPPEDTKGRLYGKRYAVFANGTDLAMRASFRGQSAEVVAPMGGTWHAFSLEEPVDARIGAQQELEGILTYEVDEYGSMVNLSNIGPDIQWAPKVFERSTDDVSLLVALLVPNRPRPPPLSSSLPNAVTRKGPVPVEDLLHRAIVVNFGPEPVTATLPDGTRRTVVVDAVQVMQLPAVDQISIGLEVGGAHVAVAAGSVAIPGLDPGTTRMEDHAEVRGMPEGLDLWATVRRDDRYRTVLLLLHPPFGVPPLSRALAADGSAAFSSPTPLFELGRYAPPPKPVPAEVRCTGGNVPVELTTSGAVVATPEAAADIARSSMGCPWTPMVVHSID